jgi:hypothetical protein
MLAFLLFGAVSAASPTAYTKFDGACANKENEPIVFLGGTSGVMTREECEVRCDQDATCKAYQFGSATDESGECKLDSSDAVAGGDGSLGTRCFKKPVAGADDEKTVWKTASGKEVFLKKGSENKQCKDATTIFVHQKVLSLAVAADPITACADECEQYVHPTDATKKCISFELLKQKGAVENADTIGYDCALMDGPCVMEAAALDSGIMGQYTLKVPSNKPWDKETMMMAAGAGGLLILAMLAFCLCRGSKAPKAPAKRGIKKAPVEDEEASVPLAMPMMMQQQPMVQPMYQPMQTQSFAMQPSGMAYGGMPSYGYR